MKEEFQVIDEKRKKIVVWELYGKYIEKNL